MKTQTIKSYGQIRNQLLGRNSPCRREANVNTLFTWFQQNVLIANSSKSYFLTSPYERRTLKIHDSIITSSSSEELLGVLIDSELITIILQDFALKVIKNLVHWLEFVNIRTYQNDACL